jgi:hypothetical protein
VCDISIRSLDLDLVLVDIKSTLIMTFLQFSSKLNEKISNFCWLVFFPCDCFCPDGIDIPFSCNRACFVSRLSTGSAQSQVLADRRSSRRYVDLTKMITRINESRFQTMVSMLRFHALAYHEPQESFPFMQK